MKRYVPYLSIGRRYCIMAIEQTPPPDWEIVLSDATRERAYAEAERLQLVEVCRVDLGYAIEGEVAQ